MKFENTTLEGLTIHYDALEEIMSQAGFYPVYDYERVTFDYKIDNELEQTYYFRLQAVAIEGEIPAPNCIVKLMKPILGQHYYPHGVEYDEDFPEKIIDICKKKIDQINNGIKSESIPN